MAEWLVEEWPVLELLVEVLLGEKWPESSFIFASRPSSYPLCFFLPKKTLLFLTPLEYPQTHNSCLPALQYSSVFFASLFFSYSLPQPPPAKSLFFNPRKNPSSPLFFSSFLCLPLTHSTTSTYIL